VKAYDLLTKGIKKSLTISICTLALSNNKNRYDTLTHYKLQVEKSEFRELILLVLDVAR
jgi:hypothetical protein